MRAMDDESGESIVPNVLTINRLQYNIAVVK